MSPISTWPIVAGARLCPQSGPCPRSRAPAHEAGRAAIRDAGGAFAGGRGDGRRCIPSGCATSPRSTRRDKPRVGASPRGRVGGFWCVRSASGIACNSGRLSTYPDCRPARRAPQDLCVPRTDALRWPETELDRINGFDYHKPIACPLPRDRASPGRPTRPWLEPPCGSSGLRGGFPLRGSG